MSWAEWLLGLLAGVGISLTAWKVFRRGAQVPELPEPPADPKPQLDVIDDDAALQTEDADKKLKDRVEAIKKDHATTMAQLDAERLAKIEELSDNPDALELELIKYSEGI